jgi:surface antigen
VAGAGFGAYADDDNRLRGAIRFGVPGAIMGGMLGHGVAQMHAEEARLALEELYKAQERKAKLEALLK